MSESTDTRYRIGQVCDLLRDEFPDISISKLRFLQNKGIIDPERTPGGYRMYSAHDVEALRMALHMQRDEFMPLRVIKEELERRLKYGIGSPSATNGVPASNSSAQFAGPSSVRSGEVSLGANEQRVSADALVRAAGVSHELLDACRAADIVEGQRDAEGIVLFTQDEVGLVQLAGRMQTLGLDVRHLRQASMAASRQGAIVEQYAAAMLRTRGDDSRERAIRTVESLTEQLGEFMRIAFIRDVKLMTRRTTAGAKVGAYASRHSAPLI